MESPRAMATALERARDFLRVAGARRAERLDAGEREAFATDLAIARQKREAATHLYRHGCNAEALALAVTGFSHARAASGLVAAQESSRAEVESLARVIESTTLPALDEEFSAPHANLLEDVLEVGKRLESDLADASLSERAVRTLRVLRPVVTAVFAVAVVVVLFAIFRKPAFTVEASAAAEPALSVDKVIDGDQKTDWALPDSTQGWVDVIPRKPLYVRRVRLLNSKNMPGPDRGTKTFRVEVYADSKLAKTVDGSFTAFTREGQWQTVEIDTPGVQRIRVTITSWFGPGGGLSEVVVE